jgi:hypothetical protein
LYGKTEEAGGGNRFDYQLLPANHFNYSRSSPTNLTACWEPLDANTLVGGGIGGIVHLRKLFS